MRTLGAVLLAAGALTIPTAAYAADTATLQPLSEREANGRAHVYPIHQGETIPVVLGVRNTGTTAVKGVVVNIRVLNDVDLPHEFTNCQYYVDSNLEGAYCSIDQELAPGAQYQLTPFHVAAAPKAANTPAIVFQWYTAEYAESEGGIEALAKAANNDSRPPSAGTGGAVALTGSDLPTEGQWEGVGFTYVKVVDAPPSTGPTTSPTTSPTTAPTAGTPTTAPSSTSATAAPTAGGDDGGGLPVTGGKTAVAAGLGLLLLLGGAVGVLMVRRRRTHFVA